LSVCNSSRFFLKQVSSSSFSFLSTIPFPSIFVIVCYYRFILRPYFDNNKRFTTYKMKTLLVTYFVVIYFSQVSLSQKCLKTNDQGPQKNQPCVFPFTLQGTVYTSCTSKTDKDGRFWCSTKVDEEGSHIKGQWGFCDRGNFVEDNKSIIFFLTRSI
jgi:hypothetical protein